ncbi:MAG: Type 1 glutamine amidotransferase-like domain-containing protein [Myxococcales bacterium]
MAKPRPLPSVLLLAGGPGGSRSAYSRLLAKVFASTGKQRPLVGYVGTANGDDPRFIGFMKGLLESAGECDFALAPLAGRKGSVAKARGVLESADAIFMGGGDVEEGMETLREKDAVGLLEAQRARGVPFFGASAGAIMLARQWVRWRDPEDDSSAEVFDCLGFAGVYCDTHGEEDRWVELHALLGLVDRGAEGHGIRTNAAIEVDAAGEVRVVAGKVDRLVAAR